MTKTKLFIFCISLGLYFFVLPIIIAFLPTIIIRINSNSQTTYIKDLTINNRCDPLPCNDIYFLMTQKKKVDKDFFFCQSGSITGNVFLQKNHDEISELGIKRDNCYDNPVLKCGKKEVMSIRVFSLIPIPQEKQEFFACLN